MEGHQLPGMESNDSLDIAVAGPLARSAHDLTLAMDILTTPLAAFGPLGWLPVNWRDPGVSARRLRVAIVADDVCAETDASVRGAIETLAAFLRERGLTVSDTARPVDSAEHWKTYVHLLRAASGSHLDDVEYADAQRRAAAHRPEDQSFPAWHWRGFTLGHRDWVHFDEVRARLRRQWAAFFAQWDLLICPVATTPAFAHNQQGFRWERMVRVNGRDQPSTQSLFWVLGQLRGPVRPAGHRGADRLGACWLADRRTDRRPRVRRPGVTSFRALAGDRVPRIRRAADGALISRCVPARWCHALP